MMLLREAKRVSACVCLAMVWASGSQGAEYSSSRGFSFVYPDAWAVVDKDSMEAMGEEAEEKLQGVRFDADQIAVMVMDPESPAGKAVNVNVVVVEGAMPKLTEKSLPMAEAMIRGQYELAEAKIYSFHTRIETVAGMKCLWTECVGRFPFNENDLHQRQVMYPGKGQTYIVTCTAYPDNFSEYEEAFEGVLASMAVDTGMHSIAPWIRQSIKVGMIGAVVAIVGALIKRRNA